MYMLICFCNFLLSYCRLANLESGPSSGMPQNASTTGSLAVKVMCGVMVLLFGRQHLMEGNLMMYAVSLVLIFHATMQTREKLYKL